MRIPKLKDRIIELRSKGCTYNEIVAKIGCSKGTVAYHCSSSVKEKHIKRQAKWRANNVLLKKVHRFTSAKPKSNPEVGTWTATQRRILHGKRNRFSASKNSSQVTYMFTIDELITKIGDNPKCYLTGRSVDLDDPRAYQLDHIIPTSKGGDNSLDNCGLTCAEANQAKGAMSNDEFLQLCKDVVKHHK